MDNQTPYQSPYQLPAGNQQPDNSSVAIQPQQQQQQQPQESWWKKLLPSIGSVIGGIGGALIPGLGETGVGEVGGYGFGQAAGQGLENLLTGKPWSQDVVKQGVEGAAFGGAGKVLGGVTKALGGSLLSKGTSMLDNLSSSQTQAAEKLAQMSKQKATQLNFAGVNPVTAESNMLKDNQAFMEQQGLPSHSPHAMDKTGQAFYDTLGAERTAAQDSTGSAQTKGLLENISKAFGINRGEGGVLPTDISNTPFDDIFNTWANRADVGVKDAVTGQLRKPTINDFMNNNVPPSQLQKLREEVGATQKSYQDLAERTSSPNAMQQAKNTSSILSQVNQSMEPLVNSQAANDAIAARTLSPTERAGYVDKYGEKFGNTLADSIDNAKNVQDLTGQLKTGVQMKNISKEAIADLQNTASPHAGARTEASDSGYGGIAEPGNLTPPEENLMQHAINAIKVAAGGGGKISKAMQLADIGARTKIAPKALEKTGSILTRIGKVTIPKAKPFESGALPSVSPLGMAAASGGALTNALASGAAGGAQQPIQQGVNMQQQPNPLQNEMNMMMMQSILAPSSLGTSANATMQTILPTLLKQAQAQSQLTALQQQLAGAGGGQGFGGNGIFNQLASHLPFTQQAAALNQVKNLGNQLGINPNINFMQNQQTQQNQLGALQNAVSGLGLGQ